MQVASLRAALREGEEARKELALTLEAAQVSQSVSQSVSQHLLIIIGCQRKKEEGGGMYERVCVSVWIYDLLNR
jgi:hypothetical protein